MVIILARREPPSLGGYFVCFNCNEMMVIGHGAWVKAMITAMEFEGRVPCPFAVGIILTPSTVGT